MKRDPVTIILINVVFRTHKMFTKNKKVIT